MASRARSGFMRWEGALVRYGVSSRMFCKPARCYPPCVNIGKYQQ